MLEILTVLRPLQASVEHSPIGILDRSRLLAGTDKCVLKYLQGIDPLKSFQLLPFMLERCALSEYFPLEEYGARRNGTARIFTIFPLFQHAHLKACNSFLFFGTSSFEMAPELEILTSADFGQLDCRYLIVEKRENTHGLRHFVRVPELTELHLNDVLMQYKDDKEFDSHFNSLWFIATTNTSFQKQTAADNANEFGKREE
ncbi:unnamed protein product [Caenorhabditis sp. 36 PRJEB53466]|nr:unnamed protein product [Caenorhabditis sp. 36 PRJEB53466]